MKRIKHILLIIVTIYLVYCMVCAVLIPRIQKKISDEYKADFEQFMSQSKQAGERVRCIDDNREALLWRIRMIESAENEIIFTTFDLDDDDGGLAFMAALYEAADRGVQVKMITDGINTMLKLHDSNYFHELCSLPNVEVKQYNPVNLIKIWKLNYRMHDKYLIIDDQMYLLGGRNTNNLFLGNYRKSYNVDRDILVYESCDVENSSLGQLRQYFDRIWNGKDVKTISGKRDAKAQDVLKKTYENLKTEYEEAFTAVDWMEATMETKGITLLSNPEKASRKEPQLCYGLHELMKKGSDIIIETPYVICNDVMYEDLTAVCQGGRSVKIMTNAVEQGANPFGCTDYLNEKERILGAGAEIYEVLYGQSLHTKTVLIDDHISIVGSFNYDIRSAYLDTELMLVIDCDELNRQLRVSADDWAMLSKHVLPDGTVSCGAEYTPVEMDGGQKLLYKILRVITRPIRHLL